MNNQHHQPQFSVEEPPMPKKQPNGRISRGPRKDKYDAINFCIAQAGQWCKLWTYEYKDGDKYPNGDTGAKACAYGGCWQRKRKLLQLAEELSVEVEVYFHNDWEEKVYTVYAMVKGKSNE